MTALPEQLLQALFTRDGATDGELLAAGNDHSFDELLKRHGPMVWGVCGRMLQGPETEDAFQATILVLVQQMRKLCDAKTVGPWLHRVAVNVASNLRRKRKYAPMGEEPASAATNGIDARIDIDSALARLPEKYRGPIVLCHLEGLSRRQAADCLGISEGTLSSLLARGMAKLRERLGSYEPSSPNWETPPRELTKATIRLAVAFPTGAALAGACPPAVAIAKGTLQMLFFKKALAITLLGIGVLTVGSTIGILRSQSTSEKELVAVYPPVQGNEAARKEAILREALLKPLNLYADHSTSLSEALDILGELAGDGDPTNKTPFFVDEASFPDRQGGKFSANKAIVELPRFRGATLFHALNGICAKLDADFRVKGDKIVLFHVDPKNRQPTALRGYEPRHPDLPEKLAGDAEKREERVKAYLAEPLLLLDQPLELPLSEILAILDDIASPEAIRKVRVWRPRILIDAESFRLAGKPLEPGRTTITLAKMQGEKLSYVLAIVCGQINADFKATVDGVVIHSKVVPKK